MSLQKQRELQERKSVRIKSAISPSSSIKGSTPPSTQNGKGGLSAKRMGLSVLSLALRSVLTGRARNTRLVKKVLTSAGHLMRQ